jgi:hypothetical protein
MKKICCYSVLLLIVIASCSKDETPDIRSAFLGSWQYAYSLSCSPPGGTVNEAEELVITKGSGSSKIVLTFESGLILECSAYSKNLFGAISFTALDGNDYTVTGSTYPDGSLDILITFSVDASYCVQDGVASSL